MAELSSRSGVAIPTIRYYLREGLLAAGEHTSPNQATYGDPHVRRLKLIRAMIDIGGLSVARARTVLEHLDSGEGTELGSLGAVQFALSARPEHVADEATAVARTEVEALEDRHGWAGCMDNPAHDTLVEVVAVLHRLGQDDVLGRLDDYAHAATGLAEQEVALVAGRHGLEHRAEGVVIVSVLGDALLAALRRLAQEKLIAQRLGGGRSRTAS